MIILPYWLSDAEIYVVSKKFACVLIEATAYWVWGNLLDETLSKFGAGVAILSFLKHHVVGSSSFFWETSVGGQFKNSKDPSSQKGVIKICNGKFNKKERFSLVRDF